MSSWMPPKAARERILLYGSGGTGKSEAALSIAARASGTVRVIDTDYSWDVLEDSYEGDNLVVYTVHLDDWDGLLDTLTKVLAETEADDWVVIDSVTPTWQAVQDWYTQKVYGEDQADYLMRVRAEDTNAKNISAYGQITDWNVINRQYARLIKMMLTCKGHVLLTAEAKAITENDGEDVKSVFGKYGTKPAGNKRLIHIPRTVIRMGKPGPGEWTMTTRKDRKRDEMVDASVVGGFARAYLWKVAGWRTEEA